MIIVPKARIHAFSSIWQVLLIRLKVKLCEDYLALDFLRHFIIMWRDLSIVFANWQSASHIPSI
jgi:hypothetical protein